MFNYERKSVIRIKHLMCPKNGGQYTLDYATPCFGIFMGYSWDIHRVFMGYTYVSGMYRVCIGYVSGIYRNKQEKYRKNLHI